MYYHGTTTVNNIQNKILPPSESGVLREGFRNYNTDVVYLTDSLPQAVRYAIKACSTFGGSPVVFECIPKQWVAERRPHEFVTPLAVVKNIVEIKQWNQSCCWFVRYGGERS